MNRRMLIPGSITVASFLLCILSTVAWGKDDVMTQARQLFKPVPGKAPRLAKNPATPAKVELGRMLYFDPRLSSSHIISCNTCHNVGLGGTDLVETSIGHGWQKGPRNSPTVLNAVFNAAQFWDGRAADLATQAKGPVQASVEMNNTPENLVATLKGIPGYRPFFAKAFPGETDPVTFDNVALAIEAFEATLITPGARFDAFLTGERAALNAVEREGLALFMGKGCSACHNGVNLGGQDYYPFGVVATPGDEVRPANDLGRFKVTKPYFHSGKVWALKDAVKIMGSAQLGISLTDAEADRIAAFLGALTGRQPRVDYPILPPNSDATPRPIAQ